MGDSDDAEIGDASPAGWLPMATAPRDCTLIVVRLGPGRRERKHDEHIVRWAGGAWRSYTRRGRRLSEDRCAGWRELDDAGREFLRRQRVHYRMHARKRKGARIALG